MSKTDESTRTEEEFEETATRTMQSLTSSFDIPISPIATVPGCRKGSHPSSGRHSTGVMSATTTVHPGQDYMDHFPISPSDDQKPFQP